MLLALAALSPARASADLRIADRAARLAVRADLERLNADLLASDSATLTLEAWCRARGMADPPVIVADRLAGAPVPATVDQRARLGIGPDEPVAYRHVRLRCGRHVLSEAENWYVPGRLTPEMNAALATGDTPFGKAIRPLHPYRRTLALERFGPLAEGAGPGHVPCDRPVFRHRALVIAGDGRVLAEVVESYRAELLC